MAAKALAQAGIGEGEWTSANDVFPPAALGRGALVGLDEKDGAGLENRSCFFGSCQQFTRRIFANVCKHIFDDRRNY
jgi:hypothetical protein